MRHLNLFQNLKQPDSILINFNSPAEEQEPTAYLRECITALITWLMKCLVGIWCDWEFATLRIYRTKCLALVCDDGTSLNLKWSGACWGWLFRAMLGLVWLTVTSACGSH